MRDGGYDISDFFNVHPDYGTLDDLVAFLEDAHRRGIRVIADLVMNHTSDQHPWFVESRSSAAPTPRPTGTCGTTTTSGGPRPGSCSSTSRRPTGPGTTPASSTTGTASTRTSPTSTTRTPKSPTPCSTWSASGSTSDSTASASTPCPTSSSATAPPGENLPETHALLRRLRKQLDADYPGRILLAEANEWPADVVDYFGDGDECHLCFHFPLMPRLFMAVRREQRYPITEILTQTPEIPDGCQWAIFLRNHDELTLEKVTDEERDYMFAEYAKDPRMKRHMGIGRRLAPLLDGDRRLAELLYALLLSLPGSPVIYYGDELLMGDNIYLGDRDSVRTPMQWTPGPQRRVQPGRLRPALPAAAHGPGLRLRGGQRRGPAAQPQLVPALDAGDAGRAPGRSRSSGWASSRSLPCANPSVLAYVRRATWSTS